MATKKVTIIAAAVVVLAAGYPATAWFLGKQIEKIHTGANADLAAVPFFKLVQHDYERSLFSANETITIELSTGLLNLLSQEEEPAPQSPLRITMKNHIQHGPLIGFSVLAGRTDSTIEFEGPFQQAVLAAFGGKPMVSAQTFYGFQGGGRSTVSIPAFSNTGGEGEQITISGDALEFTVNFTRSMAQYTFQGNMPRFEIVTPDKGGVKILGMKMEGNQQRIFPDTPMMYSGTQQLSLAELSIDPGTEADPEKVQKISIKEFNYDVQIPVAGDFVDIIAKMGSKAFLIGEQDYGPVNYDISLKHLPARKLTTLHQQMMTAAYAEGDVSQTPQHMAQVFASMKEQWIDFLLDAPEFSLDRISFRTPEGEEAKLSASIRLDDAKAEDFANPLMLLPKIDFAADIALPVELSSALGRNEQIVHNLVQQGYASVDNGLFKSKVAFKAGNLLVNDKPFNPMHVLMGASRSAPQVQEQE